MSILMDESDQEMWYPDTGATNHMTAISGILSHSQPYHDSDRILVGNGEQITIHNI